MMDESIDDMEAHWERGREEDARATREYRQLLPDLWFVLRHSGRTGHRWRVAFESRSQKEAEDFFFRSLPKKSISYACTRLTHGGTEWKHWVRVDGTEPPGVPFAIEGELKASREREAREARQTKRARRRIVVEPQIAQQQKPLSYDEFRKAHPAKRCFQRLTIEQRVEQWSTPLLSERKRNALGEFYYTHPLKPGSGYRSAKAATTDAYEVYLEQHQRVRIVTDRERVRIEVDDGAAEHEAIAVEQAAEGASR